MERSCANHYKSLCIKVNKILSNYKAKLFLYSFAMLGAYDEFKERINMIVNGNNKDTMTT